MNLLLLDPFEVAKEYPETLSHSLKFGHSRVVRFSPTGDYMASGLINGSICIFDSDTNHVIKILKRHTSVIQSMQWSHCGRYLLSASADCNVFLWDLQVGKVIREYSFGTPVWNAQLHSENPFIFIASLFNDSSVCMNWQDPEDFVLHTLPQQQQDDFVQSVKFALNNKFILQGTSKGHINVLDCDTEFQIVHTQKIASAHIKQIVINDESNHVKMFLNCSDRIIRQCSIDVAEFKNKKFEEFEIDFKYQDVVNRLQWNSINLNNNGDYLIASTYGSGAHDVYMWETTMGSLTKVLEGPKEELFDIDWNFQRCCICANGLDSGYVYLWSNKIPQKWSALAPDFLEIEENIEYDEKEDEFDLKPEEEINQQQLNYENDQIDILTKDKVDARGMVLQKLFVIPVSLEDNIEPVQDDDDD